MLIPSLLLLTGYQLNAQVNLPQGNTQGNLNWPTRDVSAFATIVSITATGEFRLTKENPDEITFTVIGGDKVWGYPYLFNDWLLGVVTTAEGKIFNNYALKFDVYHQSLYFLDGGNNPLVITDDITSFSLAIDKQNTVGLNFVNSKVYNQKGKTSFYQVIFENTKGALLKKYIKKISSLGSGIIADKTTKYFDLQSQYYFYNSEKKMLKKIIPESGAIRSLLELNDAEANKISNLDFENESILIDYFRKYISR